MKPIVVVSRCLGFDRCRYNGDVIPNRTVEILRDHVEFITVCPEVEIGLGVPRKPIRLVSDKSALMLFQPATKTDFTGKMMSFSRIFLDSIDKVDGFILKYGSPSCGPSNVKIYQGLDRRPLRGPGMFGGEVKRRFGDFPIEDEGRLSNFTIRENFLTALFTRARFRETMGDHAKMVGFHTSHKYLFMAYDQVRMRELGRIIARRKELGEKAGPIYSRKLTDLLRKQPGNRSWINVITHLYSGMKGLLGSEERKHFLDLVEEYRDERIPLSVLLRIVESWAVRFNDEYLKNQAVLHPFPKKLVEITDSGKGRTL